MNNREKDKKTALRKTKSLLTYKVTNLDKIIFRLFGQKIVATDFEGDIGCKITAYGYRGVIMIFNVEYFNAETSGTADLIETKAKEFFLL